MMRNVVIGGIAGVVAGVVIGATIVAPRLDLAARGPSAGVAIEDGPPGIGDGSPPLPVDGGPSLRWRMVSAYATTLPQLGTLAKRVETEIARVSGGRFEVRAFDPDVLVPADELFGVVASGTIDAAFASPSSWADEDPAFDLFAAAPFGPEPAEYLAWIYFGGGRELFDGLFRRRNVHALFCGLIAPEAGGWFRAEVNTVDELQGLRMRITGLGAKVMTRLGATAVPMDGGETFIALEKGSLEAAEFFTPAVDAALDFRRLGKHYYFPGWHQPATLFALIVNKDRWGEADSASRAQIETVCGDNIRYGLAEGEALQFAALAEMGTQGVKMHRWSDVILDALESTWLGVVEDESAKDASFKRAWDSLASFRRDYAIWNELGYARGR
jgi:TRAP-type mannitol/chloroaromatic compound transport system substrate-binding protein